MKNKTVLSTTEGEINPERGATGRDGKGREGTGGRRAPMPRESL